MITEKKLNSYHRRALAIASDSPDPSTQVAALLIKPESGAVICDGFNGFVRGAQDELIPKTRPEKYDYIIHAETNLLCNAVRHGISTNNCIVYCTISPCIKCMRMLYQAGITQIYVKGFYSDFDKCSTMIDLSLSVTTQGEFSMIEIKPKRN